jgi:DNA-binding beta-propeller fold protein YncE
MKTRSLATALLFAASCTLIQPARSQSGLSILNQLPKSPHRIVSTIPANGDVNPYGVAFVPVLFPPNGNLAPGDILVSNFNEAPNNLGTDEGTGTTIVRITPTGETSLFFQGTAPLGLTTALGVLRNGFVLVGNVPSLTNGASVDPPGSLLVIDRFGHLVQTLSSASLLGGPWDLTVVDEFGGAQVFVSNVLTGTITRLDLKFNAANGKPFTIAAETQIASGYAFRTDPVVLVIGPTGVAYDPILDVLYVASTSDNTIFAIDHAAVTNKDNGKGRVVYQDNAHLRGPLGLVLAPNGHLIEANGDAVNPPDPTQNTQQNNLVEFTPGGKFVTQFQIDSGAPGAAFGIGVSVVGDVIRFAAVDDDANTLTIWDVPIF